MKHLPIQLLDDEPWITSEGVVGAVIFWLDVILVLTNVTAIAWFLLTNWPVLVAFFGGA